MSETMSGRGTQAGGHTRTSIPENGPDFCDECSDAAREWVPWPCEPSGQCFDNCPHISWTGVDQHFGPGKVWACDHCGAQKTEPASSAPATESGQEADK